MSTTSSGVAPLAGDAKRSYVREMFNAIAPRYDVLNHTLSLNVDRRWRRQTVDRLGWTSRPDGTYLDLCAGTMDIAAELAGRAGFRGRVVGADFAMTMLRLGVGKAAGLRAVGADALVLPFASGRFDGCTIGFGVRNLTDLDAGLREIARILKPGGRVVILEFTTPTAWPIRPLYLMYSRRVLPQIGRLLSKHTTAYSYLPASIADFLPPEALVERMVSAGFTGVDYHSVTFGIAAIHWGVKT